MCRLPKVVVVAPPDKHNDLRRALSSLEYDISAMVTNADKAADVSGDIALVWEPDEETLDRLHEIGYKTVGIANDRTSADMHLRPDDVAAFKTRIWELFRPGN